MGGVLGYAPPLAQRPPPGAYGAWPARTEGGSRDKARVQGLGSAEKPQKTPEGGSWRLSGAGRKALPECHLRIKRGEPLNQVGPRATHSTACPAPGTPPDTGLLGRKSHRQAVS